MVLDIRWNVVTWLKGTYPASTVMATSGSMFYWFTGHIGARGPPLAHGLLLFLYFLPFLYSQDSYLNIYDRSWETWIFLLKNRSLLIRAWNFKMIFGLASERHASVWSQHLNHGARPVLAIPFGVHWPNAVLFMEPLFKNLRKYITREIVIQNIWIWLFNIIYISGVDEMGIS